MAFFMSCSGNGMLLSVSVSIVNYIFEWTLLICVKNTINVSMWPVVDVSKDGFSCAVLVAFFSRLSTKRFDMIGSNSEPIGGPSVGL